MSRSLSYLFLLLSLTAGGVLRAQTDTYTQDAFQDLPPPPTTPHGPAPPKLSFRLEAEIALPGPLPGGSLGLRDGLVAIPVSGGTMLTALTADAEPRLVEETLPQEPEPVAWVTDAAGKNRYRSQPGGLIEAQRACRRCKKGWKKIWRLRVAGNTLAPPLIVGEHVYFGALDNRVYCVKARSGHRRWAADVGGRVSSRLVSWQGRLDPANPDELLLILAVPDGGAEMVALEGREGQPLASVSLPSGTGKLVSAPLATPEGTIAVARQQYAEESASLMVYSLQEVEEDAPTEEATPGDPDPLDKAAADLTLSGR